MLRVMFDYGLQALSLVGLLGGSLAAFLWVPYPFKRYVLAALLGASVALLAYNAGYRAMKARCDQATAAYQAAINAKDASIGEAARTHEKALSEQADRHAADVDQKVLDFEKQPQAAGSCKLSPRDADRLRDIQ